MGGWSAALSSRGVMKGGLLNSGYSATENLLSRSCNVLMILLKKLNVVLEANRLYTTC